MDRGIGRGTRGQLPAAEAAVGVLHSLYLCLHPRCDRCDYFALAFRLDVAVASGVVSGGAGEGVAAVLFSARGRVHAGHECAADRLAADVAARLASTRAAREHPGDLLGPAAGLRYAHLALGGGGARPQPARARCVALA